MVNGQFIPPRVFAEQLPNGFFDLSCHFIIDEDNNCDCEQISWKIITQTGESVITSIARSSQNAFLIAAVLPPSFHGGVLEVAVSSHGETSRFEKQVEIYQQEVDFTLPLEGRALVVLGHRIGEAHRSALQIPSQQFGWDFLGLAAESLGIVNIHQSNPLTTVDFPGFGREVIAPADGEIADVRDGMDDIMEVGQLPEDMSYFLEDLTRALGNYVIIKHSNSVWSVSAHLKKGSLRVEAGQEIRQGNQLGSLGNSGFSSGPHLHFHVMDGPDILHASPLPIVMALEEGSYSPQAGEIVSNA